MYLIWRKHQCIKFNAKEVIVAEWCGALGFHLSSILRRVGISLFFIWMTRVYSYLVSCEEKWAAVMWAVTSGGVICKIDSRTLIIRRSHIILRYPLKFWHNNTKKYIYLLLNTIKGWKIVCNEIYGVIIILAHYKKFPNFQVQVSKTPTSAIKLQDFLFRYNSKHFNVLEKVTKTAWSRYIL